jgi:alkylation response protein AidB-like acyl-CoA dehydrogenase
MEFGFTEEQEKLRKEIHDFFVEELPVDHRPGLLMTEEQLSFGVELQKKAGKKGYLAPGWSKESGGMGLSDMEQGIILEEQGYWGIFWPGTQGLRICGPAVHLFGTEEQKRKFLPGIAKGETIWYQAQTEPDAGSDEANMHLRAVKDGNDYILNGQKAFITAPAPADYLYTLARTEDTVPKHRGISLFLVPAHAPGVSYRALPTMGGFTVEIFYDDVRVSQDYLVGEINRGFYHAMATFMFERSGTGAAASGKRGLEEFVQFCKETKRNRKLLIDDPQVREALAQMAVEAEVERLCGWHGQWYFSQREKLGSQPYNLGSFYTKTSGPIRSERIMDMFGLYGQLRKGSESLKYEGRAERSWQASRSTHPAGTIEINKVVIADRGLGLPRIPIKLREVIGRAVKEDTAR